MATHRTTQSFLAALAKYPEKIKKGEVRAVGEAALIIKTSVLQELQSASGGDLRLSGVGRRGAKVGVHYSIIPVGPSALVKATGPVHLIERGTRAHEIPRAGRRQHRQLVINGQVVMGPVRHPGTAGRYPWRRGTSRARPLVARLLGRLRVLG